LKKLVPGALLRRPDEIMRLERMGSAFQTRLSFMRSLTRRMAIENWEFSKPDIELDREGRGRVIYSVFTGSRHYSLLAFSHPLDPMKRSDRVIAHEWDATFNLFDGIPLDKDIERLRGNTPLQEAGRFTASELVLARANISERLFNHVANSLAEGRQPDIEMIADVGYLMRTTAVYGGGKFGCADWEKIADRADLGSAFQAEMLAVYLIRLFSLDLVEHMARQKGDVKAVKLALPIRRFLGIGNATGLGMAPFLMNHQVLVHQWVSAKEHALAAVRGVDSVSVAQVETLNSVLAKCRVQVSEWQVDDEVQSARIEKLAVDLTALAYHLAASDRFDVALPVDAIFRWASQHLGLEAQELVVSLLIEPFGELVDNMGERFNAASEEDVWEPAMRLTQLNTLIDRHYGWVNKIDFQDREETDRQWVYSEEKLEPRLGPRANDGVTDSETEMPLTVGWDIARLRGALQMSDLGQSVLQFCALHPRFRHTIRRIQNAEAHPYGEVADNVIAARFRPIDILRFKLAFFGVSKFDPKSDLWTRVNMYQGAPFPDELNSHWADQWAFTCKPGQIE
jgi:hypothetical protein